jgi:outer membrane lipoprotein-sorting protein
LSTAASLGAQTGKQAAQPAKQASKEAAPTPDAEAVKLTKRLAQKYDVIKRYAFEGNLEVARQTGEDPKQVLTKAKVKLEVAPGGKYVLHVKKEGSEYSLISDGHKTWSYVPALGQYTEQDAATGGKPLDTSETPLSDLLEGKGDVTERFARQIVPVVTGTVKAATLSFIRGPVLTVIGKKDSHERQTLLYLTVNSATLAIPRLTWMQSTQLKETRFLVRTDITFTDSRFDNDVPDSDFSFNPPADAKRVDTLEIPGREGPSAN